MPEGRLDPQLPYRWHCGDGRTVDTADGSAWLFDPIDHHRLTYSRVRDIVQKIKKTYNVKLNAAYAILATMLGFQSYADLTAVLDRQMPNNTKVQKRTGLKKRKQRRAEQKFEDRRIGGNELHDTLHGITNEPPRGRYLTRTQHIAEMEAKRQIHYDMRMKNLDEQIITQKQALKRKEPVRSAAAAKNARQSREENLRVLERQSQTCRYWKPLFTGEQWNVRSFADAPEEIRVDICNRLKDAYHHNEKGKRPYRDIDDILTSDEWGSVCDGRIDRVGGTIPPSGHDWPYWGTCIQAELSTYQKANGTSNTLAVAIDGSMYHAELRTRCNFECVQWKLFDLLSPPIA